MSEREREARRARLAALREAGVDPYPARVAARETVAGVSEHFADHDEQALEADPVTVSLAGRLMALRPMGKLVFGTLLENGARLQISARKSEIPAELFAAVKTLDVGDFLHVEGPLWRTRKGELTVDLRGFQLLAKSLAPLPEKWHGLKDVEVRFRKRHLDILVNEDARRIMLQRSAVVRAMREVLDGRGFLEV